MARISAQDGTVTMPDWLSAVDMELELKTVGYTMDEIGQLTREEATVRYWALQAKRGGI